jgi:hypothetical protein
MKTTRERRTDVGRRGTTLVELTIGMTLFTSVAGALFLAFDLSAGSYGAEATGARLDAQARHALDVLGNYLREADLDSLTPAGVEPPDSATLLDYQRPDGFAGGLVTWGPTERITLELDAGEAANGLDDDGDGRIDERRLTWIQDIAEPDSVRVVLCSGISSALEDEIAGNNLDDNGNGLVDEAGFCVEFEDARLLVRLTLEDEDHDGRRILRTVERAILPRNTPEE